MISEFFKRNFYLHIVKTVNFLVKTIHGTSVKKHNNFLDVKNQLGLLMQSSASCEARIKFASNDDDDDKAFLARRAFGFDIGIEEGKPRG